MADDSGVIPVDESSLDGPVTTEGDIGEAPDTPGAAINAAQESQVTVPQNQPAGGVIPAPAPAPAAAPNEGGDMGQQGQGQTPQLAPRIMSMLTGNGAAPYEPYEQARQASGQEDPTAATGSAILSDPANAAAYLQTARQVADMRNAQARHALNTGDAQGAAAAATDANANTPDGVSITFQTTDNTPQTAGGVTPDTGATAGFSAHIKDLRSGDEKVIPLTPEQMHAWLTSPASRFDAMMQGGASGLEKVAQGQGRPLEQGQPGSQPQQQSGIIDQMAQAAVQNDPGSRTANMIPASVAYAKANPQFAAKLQHALQSNNGYLIAKLGNEANLAGYGRGSTDSDLSMNPLRVGANGVLTRGGPNDVNGPPQASGTNDYLDQGVGKKYTDFAAENEAHQKAIDQQQPLLRVVKGGIGNPVDRATGQPVTFGQPKDLVGLQKTQMQEAGKNARANAANIIKQYGINQNTAAKELGSLINNQSLQGKNVTPAQQAAWDAQIQQRIDAGAARVGMQPQEFRNLVDAHTTLGQEGASPENPIAAPPAGTKPVVGQWYGTAQDARQWTGNGWLRAAPGQQSSMQPGGQPQEQTNDMAAGHVGNQPYYLQNEGLTPEQSVNASVNDNRERSNATVNWSKLHESERHNQAQEAIGREKNINAANKIRAGREVGMARARAEMARARAQAGRRGR